MVGILLFIKLANVLFVITPLICYSISSFNVHLFMADADNDKGKGKKLDHGYCLKVTNQSREEVMSAVKDHEMLMEEKKLELEKMKLEKEFTFKMATLALEVKKTEMQDIISALCWGRRKTTVRGISSGRWLVQHSPPLYNHAAKICSS